MVVILTGLVLFLICVVFVLTAYIRWQLDWSNMFKMGALIFGKNTIKDLSELARLRYVSTPVRHFVFRN